MSFNEWKTKKLGDISLKITKGTTPSTIGSEFANDGIKFFRSESLTNRKYLDVNKLKFINGSTHAKMQRSQLAEKDILFSMAGMFLGKTAIVTKSDVPSNINQAVALIRLNHNIADYNYIYYYLNQKYVVEYVNSSSSQSAQPNINLKQIGDIDISIPPVPIQQSIASILSSLDDKIELNNRIHKMLEQMVQAIFKQWFVDFDFPNETGEPYKSSDGKMEFCEELEKEIPLGWKVQHLKDLCELITKGTTPTTLGKSFISNGIGFIKAESITNDHNFDISKFAYIDEETNMLLKRSIIQEDDILFTIAGTLGRFARVTYDILPANTNQAVAIIRPKKSIISSYFILCYFLSNEHINFYSARTQQAVQANLSLTTIGDLPLVIPSENVLTSFYRIITDLFSKIDNTVKQINRLINLRDTLLPKLMSGEIDVSETEL